MLAGIIILVMAWERIWKRLPVLRKIGRIGIGMAPRGEVGMVVAQMGLSMGVIGPKLYGVVVFAALATTLAAPPLLNLVYTREEESSLLVADCSS